MVCPGCKLQLRIKNSYTEVRDGAEVTVQELHCVNPQCPQPRTEPSEQATQSRGTGAGK